MNSNINPGIGTKIAANFKISHNIFLEFPSKQKGSESLLSDPVHIDALNSFIFTYFHW
jgi:hypothetical protein